MPAPARRSLKILATLFGLGLIPFAPGTFGTVGALPLVWFLARLGELEYLGWSLAFIVASILISHAYEFEIAHEHDTPELVIDEVAGYLVTMAMLPITWPTLLAGFVAFRFFDILKPWPISWMDRKILGGVGAVADDLAAGILASLVLQLAHQRGYL